MKETTFVAVSGFFSSGSSAVVDMLKEYKETFECKAEIRIIKDPYGLAQLENALVDNWELINSAAAINDFLWLCKICSRNYSRFPLARVGLGHSKNINSNFMKITQEFIDSLTIHKYKRDFYHNKFKKNYFRYVLDRILWGFEFKSNGKIKIANRMVKPLVFAKPTREEFSNATQKYFEKLFEDQIIDGDKKFIILDQAVSPNNTQVIHRYFKKAKMIIVTRDPRDTYITDIHWAVNLDNDLTSKEAGVKYAKRQKALYENIYMDKDIIKIKFEDLIMNYDETKRIIQDFLGLSEGDHINKFMYLNPDVSSKNVGIWKKYTKKYGEVFDAIENEVPELCYEKK